MQYFSQIFTDYMRLSVGTNSESFCEYTEFFYCRSYFDDSWYNLIIPKLKDSTKFNFQNITTFIEKERQLGKSLSFYINQELLASYIDILNKAGYSQVGSDVYLVKDLKNSQPPTIAKDYIISNEYDLLEITAVLQKCFPEWSTERTYSQLYEDYKLKGQEDRFFETFVVRHLNKIVGGGSVSIDKSLNLGYLHNAGILEPHRRIGLHTALIDERCAFCLKNGVTRALSIVDEDAGSFASLQKDRFAKADKFYVFSK